ncbi:MAG: hypothetical protein IJT37_12955 [Lachnospiraceae bacterium]|nr:hypothetical protein [Lachnospiraceae bacterium]
MVETGNGRKETGCESYAVIGRDPGGTSEDRSRREDPGIGSGNRIGGREAEEKAWQISKKNIC